jgi:GNAT superfamily N-acetyltransferase
MSALAQVAKAGVKGVDYLVDALRNSKVGKMLSEDEYIAAINPTGKRVTAAERPNIYAADIEGMAPYDAMKVGGNFVDKTGAKVSILKDPSTGGLYAKVGGREAGYMTPLSAAEMDLAVAKEFQNRGIGSMLSAEFRRANPFAQSGGLTEAGENTARAAYRNIAKTTPNVLMSK